MPNKPTAIHERTAEKMPPLSQSSRYNINVPFHILTN